MKEQASHSDGTAGRQPRRLAANDLRDQILHVIEEYGREHSRPPTIREICAAVHVESTSHVAYHVSILKRAGLVNHAPGSRGLTSARSTGLPVLGTIAAGDPLDQFDEGEAEMLDFGELAPAINALPTHAEREVYALRVRGTSMIEDGILDGDYVIIAPGSTVTNGEIGVAVRNTANGGRGAATLKHIFVNRDSVRLQPANAELEPRFIPAKEWKREWTVQGTVVAVHRQFAPHRTATHR